MNEERVVQEFLYKPMQKFGVRELARETGLDTKTIMKYLRKLVNEKIVLKDAVDGSFAKYEANRNSISYRLFKSNFLTKRLALSGLIDFLYNKLRPNAIVLFGSVQKGTYVQKSDIDIFIQSKEEDIDVSYYKRKIGHDIQLFFEEDLNELTEGLRNNIVSGYTVVGRLRI